MKKFLAAIFLCCCLSFPAKSTHLRCGWISVEQIDGLKCKIKITVYTNTGSSVLFGGRAGEEDRLDFGDGTSILVPETQNTPRPDLGVNVGEASFTILHTFSDYGFYRINYHEYNRNEGIINFSNSVNAPFYIETRITLSTEVIYSTPELLSLPIMIGSISSSYSGSIAAVDLNDNQLYYHLVPNYQDEFKPVDNYKFPEEMSLDPISGLLTWDCKFNGVYNTGEYNFAVTIYQLKEGALIGYMLVDFQLIMTDLNYNPIFEGGESSNGRVYIPENTSTQFRIEAGSPNTEDIILQVKSELEQFPENFSYTIEDSVHENTHFKLAKIIYSNTSDIIRNNPYIIQVRTIFDHKISKDMTFIIATKDIFYEDIILGSKNEVPKFKVFPNPVSDFLEIKSESRLPKQITLYDMHGRTVLSTVNSASQFLDLRALPEGVYILSVVAGDSIIKHKIVKH